MFYYGASSQSVAGGFTPADVAGLLWWHESGVGLTTSGSNYTVWANQAATGSTYDWAQANTSLAPNTGRTINSRAAPDFDGTKRMAMGDKGGFGATGHVLWGGIIDTVADFAYLFEDGALSDPDEGWQLRQDTTDGEFLLQTGNGTSRSSDDSAGATFTAGVAVLIQAWWATGTNAAAIKIGGTAVTMTLANQPDATWSNVLALMATASGSNNTDGAIAITLGYSAQVSGADLTAIEGYCNSVLGI